LPEIIGYIIGVISVVIATYSIIRQWKLETKLKEKERLKKLTENLKGVINALDVLCETIENPSTDEDLEFQIEAFSDKVVSEAFNRKTHVVEVTNPMERYRWVEKGGEEKKEIEYLPFEKGKALEYFEASHNESSKEHVSMSTYVGESIGFDLFVPMRYLSWYYGGLKKMEEFTDIIENFSGGLLNELKDRYSKISEVMINSALESEKLKVNIKKFKKSQDIGLWVYHQIIGYEELKQHLSKLNNLKMRLEKLRNDVTISSYA